MTLLKLFFVKVIYQIVHQTVELFHLLHHRLPDFIIIVYNPLVGVRVGWVHTFGIGIVVLVLEIVPSHAVL